MSATKRELALSLALCRTRGDEKDARIKELEAALRDCLSGLSYILQEHGQLYGVGWARIATYQVKYGEHP